MTLRVVGAGLGRTGTSSLKLALERLLGGRCYHMSEVFARPDDTDVWRRAYLGEAVDLAPVFDEFVAAVDWPAAGLWDRLAARFPDAVVLLSSRPADDWWVSADATILRTARAGAEREAMPAAAAPWLDMADAMFGAFGPIDDEAGAKAAFVAHNAAVRAAVPADRLVEWSPGDGWAPLCAALDVTEPDEPFPHTNTTAEFRDRHGWR